MVNVLTNDAVLKVLARRIVLAYFGGTKGGKTTGIAALTKIPDVIIDLASGDDGRTKTTVQYHIVSNEQLSDILVEDIEIFEQNIVGSITGDIQKYNEQLKKEPVLKKVLGLEPLAEGDDVRKYVSGHMKQFKGTTPSIEKLKLLMCSENIDRYIRRITLAVPAHSDVADYIIKNRIDLFIRDTRGLLDIALDSNNGKEQSPRTLRELGLEGLDGIVFFCAESYPNIIQELYHDTFKSVFQSVPVFLIARDNMMFKIFNMNSQPTNYENVESLIDNIQQGRNTFYTDIEEQYFLNTFALMEKFDITSFDSVVRSYRFKDTFFNQQKVEFLLPSCASLKSLSVSKLHSSMSNGNISTQPDFIFYQTIAVVSCIKMLKMICHLQEGMSSILKSGLASDCLWNVCLEPVNMNSLEKDFSRYDNYHTSYDATSYVKPQFTTISKGRIEQDIDDETVELLGSRGGITTTNNGKLRYPTTAVTAVTSRQWISKLISSITIKGNLTNPITNEELFPDLQGNMKAQETLLQKALYYILYKRYTDVNATIQYYLLVDRNKVVDGILRRRNARNTSFTSFIEVIRNVVEDFCDDVRTSYDISEVYRNSND
ncbi:hypothetical protein [Paenibacillus piscarius]|uniref:hypothetical protein n=1 Tax=Paenibacillus piscarius TaxID=1089681 RepID=UPI001EE7E905|nr:hypothetical protein [Paenibacillus piscarius]